MNRSKETDPTVQLESNSSDMSRRSFFKRATAAGASGALVVAGLGTLASAQAKPEIAKGSHDNHGHGHDHDSGHLTKQDRDILVAAQLAEALAVTMYSNIIKISPFFPGIPDDDQGYLKGALEEEMSHYLLEQSVTNQSIPVNSFFFPANMFFDTQTTLNTLVTLEDAFIAAYLVGVRNFSTPDLRVTAARIMGIESDHRTLARVIGPDVAAKNGGPIATITGIQGVAESVAPPNNNGYERTLCWSKIEQAVQALMPFVDMNAAQAAGFDTSKSYPFVPFNPVLPSPLGEFISFKGC